MSRKKDQFEDEFAADELEPTRVRGHADEHEPISAPEPQDELEASLPHAQAAEDPVQDAMSSLNVKLQKAQAQKIEAELNLRKFALERDIEQLEHSHLTKTQQLSILGQQTSLKQNELQNLRHEIQEISEAISEKRLTVEGLKTSIEEERQELTGLKHAASDLQLDIQRLHDTRRSQETFLLDHDRQIKKFQERQNAMLAQTARIEEDLEALQDMFESEKNKLDALLLRQAKAQENYDKLLEVSSELDKAIHARKNELAAIIEECQDQSRIIMANARRDAEAIRDEAQKAADLLLQESLQKAHQTASEKLSQAEASADRIMADGRMEATRLLATSRDKSRALVEEAENHSAKLTARAQSQYEQMIEEARKEVAALINKAQSDGERLTEEAKKRIQILQTAAYEEKQRILDSANQTQRQMLDDAQRLRQEKIEEAHRYAKEIVDEAVQAQKTLQKESEGLAAYLDKEKARFHEALTQERTETLKELNRDRQTFTERVRDEEKRLESLRQQLINDFTREKTQLYQDVEREKAQAAEQAVLLMKAAEDEHRKLEATLNEKRLAFEKELLGKKEQHEKDLLDRTQKLTEEWNKKGEKIAKSLEQKAQELADQNQAVKLKAEEDIKALRAQTERELVQQRMQQETALQNWVKAQQESFQNVHSRHRAQILDTITALVQTAVRPHVPGLDPQKIAQLGATIRKAADEAFLEAEKQTQAAAIQSQQSPGARAAFKDLRYWRHLFLHSSLKWGALGLAIALAIFIWNYNSEQTSMSAQNSYVADEIKKRKRVPYAPEQTHNFKANYTDNVLYTTDYLDYERHKDIRNRWIVALNRYGLDKLDISNEAIVKLLAKEATMLKQLERMRGEIDAKDPGPEIIRMRELEEKYRQQLIGIVGSEEKFKTFLTFKAHYFEKAMQQPLN